MKYNVVLIIDGSTTCHESIKDAIEHSSNPKYDDAKIAHIYTYHMTARKAGFRWNTDDDKPKRLERKKSTAKRFMKRWTDKEEKLLVQARKDGVSLLAIAETLHRSVKAVELKAKKLC